MTTTVRMVMRMRMKIDYRIGRKMEDNCDGNSKNKTNNYKNFIKENKR